MPDYSKATSTLAGPGGHKSTGNQPIRNHGEAGVIKSITLGGKRYQGFVQRDDDIPDYVVAENNNNVFTIVNPSTGIAICYVYADSYWTYNGDYDLYQFFYADGTFVGLGSLHVHDMIDGERDTLYRGTIPSNNWDPRHNLGSSNPLHNPNRMAKSRLKAKNKIRAPAPIATPWGYTQLYYHRDAFDNPDHHYIVLAGPLLFSPENNKVYDDVVARVNRGEFDCIPNEGVVVTRDSLAIILECLAKRDSSLFWDSACGRVYPMYCLHSGFWTWAPLAKPGSSANNDGSYDPLQFLAGYYYYGASVNLVDPRMPSEFLPADGGPDGAHFYRDMTKRGSAKGKGRSQGHSGYESASSSSTLK